MKQRYRVYLRNASMEFEVFANGDAEALDLARSITGEMVHESSAFWVDRIELVPAPKVERVCVVSDHEPGYKVTVWGENLSPEDKARGIGIVFAGKDRTSFSRSLAIQEMLRLLAGGHACRVDSADVREEVRILCKYLGAANAMAKAYLDAGLGGA